jgi:uracil-DNA glycosylase family 4
MSGSLAIRCHFAVSGLCADNSMNQPSSCFDPLCRKCSRLVDFLSDVRDGHADYHAAPVASFGDPDGALLIVGLAPGMHGANRTGRPFTGDYAGILLYRTLHRFGFASAPESLDAADGLQLYDCLITNAVKCLPPANKPLGEEVRNCRPYLQCELERRNFSVFLALGRVAHQAVVAALGLVQKQLPFAHGGCHALADGRVLIDSYHCSRYNTQTGRLTEEMFQQVVAQARASLGR